MAGVEDIPTTKEIKRMRQNQSLDYNKQIPFKRDVPEFVYKVEEHETPKSLGFAEAVSLQSLEEKRRDVEEELQKKLDKRRLKKLKERDMKTIIKQKINFEKPASFPLDLP